MTYCTCDTREEHPASECIGPWETAADVQQRDVAMLLDALGLPDHARPYSPHAVIHRDVLPGIAAQASEYIAEAMRQQQRVERALLLAAAWDREADCLGASLSELMLRDAAKRLREAVSEEGKA